jgi:glucosylceramidase
MVIYWNLALNEDFGPHNGGCANCRPVVTVANNNSWIAYNEEYYGLAQFGKFVSENGSNRLGVTMQGGWGCMNGTAFINNDNSVVGIVSNFCQTPQFTTIARPSDYVEVRDCVTCK